MLLAPDPLTRIVSYDTVYELASRWGDVKARNILKDRYVIVLIARKRQLSRSLLKIYEFRPDLRAGVDKIVEIKGRKYTIGEYYSEYLKLPEMADLIPDDALIIKLKPPNSSRILYSLLYCLS